MTPVTSIKSNIEFRVTKYLSGQVLLNIVSGNEDPAFEAPTLQLQVLPLSPQQVRLLLRLRIDTMWHYMTCCHVYGNKVWGHKSRKQGLAWLVVGWEIKLI